MNALDRLLDKRKITKISIDRQLITKELDSAEYDLTKADKSFQENDYKWATVQSYYTMFHAARALLFSKGYREKSHRALVSALEELFVKTNTLEQHFIDDFVESMELREEADYGSIYSEESSRLVLTNAKAFLQKVIDLLNV